MSPARQPDPLYLQVTEYLRRQIVDGTLLPGDRLPPIRDLSRSWKTTPGTVHRAFRELAQEGLVVSRAGGGTVVARNLPVRETGSLRLADLVHRAEELLLDGMRAGHTSAEVEEAFALALDRWRAVKTQACIAPSHTLRFAGSHDVVIAWLAGHFRELIPAWRLDPTYSGSLGGLLALANGRAEIAGCHLLDEESGDYNVPFVRRVLPGRPLILATLAHRRLGLFTAPGDPCHVTELADLARPGLRFVNRQQGSGVRVWLDQALQQAGVDPKTIRGFEDERATHSEVADAIAEGQADAGIGLEAAAGAFGLRFVPLLLERYELVVPAEWVDREPVSSLMVWLRGAAAKDLVQTFAGYDATETGAMRTVG